MEWNTLPFIFSYLKRICEHYINRLEGWNKHLKGSSQAKRFGEPKNGVSYPLSIRRRQQKKNTKHHPLPIFISICVLARKKKCPQLQKINMWFLSSSSFISAKKLLKFILLKYGGVRIQVELRAPASTVCAIYHCFKGAFS